jgi:molybdenum cofactor synthesis domain-containing protein
MATAAILTIGNEVLAGDTLNTNAAWLAQRLERLGVRVRHTAVLPDEIDEIAGFVRERAAAVDFLIVTGGLGGTPDDLTREAIAAAFGLEQEEVPEVAADLRARFTRDPEYAARWALDNPRGGAPGFVVENVYVFPGLPAEMEAMFDSIADEFRGAPPIDVWRRRYRTRESEIAALLAEAGERWPDVLVGSYPSFEPTGPEVEVVLKSSDGDALDAARAFVEQALG